ncbi:hypothetical protein ACFVY4_33445 [Streptomyces sp. NPDC058299]|uniref:hypothetical protein n=1 Tax=Streptomyces sp. NPDC058299 TaxID=3346435 RepID=UPI0036E15599
MHRKTAIATLGALLTAATLTACGGSGSPSANPGTGTATKASASSSSAPTPTPQEQLLSKKRLTAALLPLSAMPAGWSVDTSGSDSGDKTFCDYKQPHAAHVKLSRSFQKGGGLSASVATVGLRQYASAKDAGEAFDALEQALQTCHSETYQGSKLTYTAMSVDKVGDRSLGVRIETGGVTLLQQFTLAGPVLANVGAGGMANVDADETAQLLRKRVDRYEAAARS